jgi:epoxyqueuosine reductase
LNFSQRIKTEALKIGFHKVGIARAEDLSHEREQLQNWLNRGFHGEMAWLEREPEKRTNPQILLPGAKSVVAVALNYYTPHKHCDAPTRGKISRYAWGDDYHEVLREKLSALLEYIKREKPDANAKICVDTAPITDKIWAQRAGLGWIGKNSNLITREFGSWVFLGEIVLDLELDYDQPELQDFCGNCRICLEACPTKAIIEPRVVDSNRCISYATIESRADNVSAEVAQNLSGWLYGCDTCQDVCPWNRFEKPTTETRFEPRPDNVSPDLIQILELSPEEYAQRFRRSAIKRAKISGLQRNARALLKNRNAVNENESEN